jgi:hypothetical protein
MHIDTTTSKNVKTFISLCAWLTAKEFDCSVSSRRYDARYRQMQDIRDTLTQAEIAALYLSGVVHPRFVR